jgi:hypothetical protein
VLNRTRSEDQMEMDVMEHKREHSKADMTKDTTPERDVHVDLDERSRNDLSFRAR